MAVALAEGLRRRGHRVTWSLLRDPGPLGAQLGPEADPAFGLAPGRVTPAGLPRLARRLGDCEGLYVLDHQNAVVLAALAAGRARVPRRVVAIHTTGLWGGKPSLGRLFRRALPAYDAVLALSESHRTYLRDREKVPEEKIRIVPNGIDLARFRALRSRAEAREALGLDPADEIVGSVAMLRPEKNHALLLDAASALVPRRPRLKVVLVGDGPEREALERRAGDGNLAGRVRFLGRRKDIPEILSSFDLFALVSHPAVETQPVAVLEALAAGLPVLATRVGDLPAMLEEGRCGRLIEPGDRGACERELESLLEDAGFRSTLGAAARRRAADFGIEASVTALERVLSGSVS